MKENLTIVSLIPSSTEIVCALGLEKNLVGISHECDFPPSVKNLPVLTRPNLNPEAPSPKIHSDVQELLKKGLSIYEIETELLKKLEPDLIVTQDQCEVCAVSLRDVEKALCNLTKKEIAVCSLKPHSLDDIVTDLRKVGKFTGTENKAEDLVTEFWIKLNAVNAKAGTTLTNKPKVLCLEWLDPLMVGGGWLPELVDLAGGENLLVKPEERFKTISWEEAWATQPDVIVLMPCGYSLEKTWNEVHETPLVEKFKGFKAARDGKMFIVDGNQYFNRPGPRIAESCEILGTLIHPQKFTAFIQKYNNTAYKAWRSS